MAAASAVSAYAKNKEGGFQGGKRRSVDHSRFSAPCPTWQHPAGTTAPGDTESPVDGGDRGVQRARLSRHVGRTYPVPRGRQQGGFLSAVRQQACPCLRHSERLRAEV